jgi:hypothetical protein
MEVNDNVPGPVFSDVAVFTISDNEIACSEGQAWKYMSVVCH